MKILHIVARSQRRGAEMVALELAEELDDLGHDNRVVALAAALDGGTDPDIEALAGTPALGPLHMVEFVWLVRRELRRRPVDAVLLHGGLAAQITAAAAPRRRRGGPILVWQRILGFPTEMWRPLRRHSWVFVAKRMDGAVSLTPELSAELRRLGYPGPIWEINNFRRSERFVDIDRAVEAQRLRAAVGVTDPSVHLIGFVGHLVDQKRPLRALEVLQGVLQNGVRAHLVMAGDGPLRGELEHEIQGRGLSGAVTVLGYRKDVEHILGGVELTLLTSDSEAVPGVAIEAQMAGSPVVSFQFGGIRAVVEDGETGLVIDGFDTTVMAERVTELLTDPARLEAMGRRARSRTPEFSAARAARIYDTRLRDLTAQSQP